MTEEELARALCRAHVEGVGGWGEGAWLAVARRARELLSAPALPAEPPPGFVRVRGKVTFDHGGGWELHGSQSWKPDEWAYSDHRWPFVATVVADVRRPEPPAEIVGSVE